MAFPNLGPHLGLREFCGPIWRTPFVPQWKLRKPSAPDVWLPPLEIIQHFPKLLTPCLAIRIHSIWCVIDRICKSQAVNCLRSHTYQPHSRHFYFVIEPAHQIFYEIMPDPLTICLACVVNASQLKQESVRRFTDDNHGPMFPILQLAKQVLQLLNFTTPKCWESVVRKPATYHRP